MKKLWNTSLVPIQWAKPHGATKTPQLLCVKLEDPKKFTSQALRRSRAVIHLAISTGSVGRPLGRAARQPKQRVDGRRVARPAGAMAHSLTVSLLAGIRREVVRVGVATCSKCRGGMHGFIQIEKVSHISPRGRDDLPMRFGKCKGGRLSPKQFLTTHLI